MKVVQDWLARFSPIDLGRWDVSLPTFARESSGGQRKRVGKDGAGLTRRRTRSKLATMSSPSLATLLPALAPLLASLSLLAAAPAATATKIRCQDASGKVTYQDSTCPNGARGVPIDPYQSTGTRFATREEINRALRPEPPPKPPRADQSLPRKPHREGDPTERRFIAPGVTAAQVRAKIGEPDYKERAPGAGHSKSKRNAGGQHWVYLPTQGDPQTTTTLTLKDGVVTQVERRVTY
jgi:hypothetical protein